MSLKNTSTVLFAVFCLFGASARAGASQIMLPIGPVFDQGDTEWCWAYSAFHTLRTYNFDASSVNADIKAWRDALTPLNTPDAFASYMGEHFSTGRTGDPQDLIDLLEQEKSLPKQGWVSYYPSDRISQREARLLAKGALTHMVVRHGSSHDIMLKVTEGLKHGVPAMYCTPPHCMMIYGVVLEGDTPTAYAIADSNGGVTRQSDADDVEGDLDEVLTMP